MLVGIHNEYKSISSQSTKEKLVWINAKVEEYKKENEELYCELEQSKMSLLCTMVWFDGYKRPELNSSEEFNIDVDGTTYQCSISINDTKVYMD